MIKNHFSDVKEISMEVLELFASIPPSLEIGTTRFIRKLASLLQNVKYGKITRRNCEGWAIVTEGMNLHWSGDQRMVKLCYG